MTRASNRKHQDASPEQIALFRLTKVAEAIGLEEGFRPVGAIFPASAAGLGVPIPDQLLLQRTRDTLREAGLHSVADMHHVASPVLIVEAVDYQEVTPGFVETALARIDALAKPTIEQGEAIKRLSRISASLGLEPFRFDPGPAGQNPGASMVVTGQFKARQLQTILTKAGLDGVPHPDPRTKNELLTIPATELPKIDSDFVSRVLQSRGPELF